MEIRGLGEINPIDKNHQPKKVIPTSIPVNSKSNLDSLNVSDEARFLEDEAFIKEVLAKIPDIDQAKIDRVKQKLEQGVYNNKEHLDILTENLMKALGL